MQQTYSGAAPRDPIEPTTTYSPSGGTAVGKLALGAGAFLRAVQAAWPGSQEQAGMPGQPGRGLPRR